MIETIGVIVIVLVVAFLTGRSLYRTLTGANDGCGCCSKCPGCDVEELVGAMREQETKK